MAKLVQQRDGRPANPGVQPDRRRASRAALSLAATMREGNRKVRVRLIDISTHGCRIECSSTVEADSWLWLNIAGLEAQHCRVVWHCQEFIGLEFEHPLLEVVFERLLETEQQPPETRVHELRDIAARTHWLARQADEQGVHPLADLSRTCAVDALVEGLQLSGSKAGSKSAKTPPTPPSAA